MSRCHAFAPLLTVTLLPWAASFATAQEEQAAEAIKRYQAYAQATAAMYELRTGGEEPRQLKRREESLLRWTNPLSGNKSHGELFLWTDRGRPAAVLSMYEWTDVKGVVHEHHEWCSLALGAPAAAGPRTWEPKSAGIELKPLPDAPARRPTRPLRRLRQMRELAGGFTAEKTTRKSKNVSSAPARPSPRTATKREIPEVLDGALFALGRGDRPGGLPLHRSPADRRQGRLALRAGPHEQRCGWRRRIKSSRCGRSRPWSGPRHVQPQGPALHGVHHQVIALVA